MDEMLLKGRLKGFQRLALAKLLDMEYTPGELAMEVGFTRRQVYRVYIHYGLPYRRDETKHLWINGKAFREWYEATYPRIKLGIDEGFCLTCKKGVKMNNPKREKRKRLVYWVFNCPTCGRKIPRIIKQEARKIDDRARKLETA